MGLNSSGLPATIGRFRIEECLGSGGMGDVYKGFDPSLKRHVAVKTVRAEMEGPEFIERLYREAQACARLQHPHIVTVYEVGEFDGGVFIAMEYLKGQSLSAAIADGRLLLRDKLAILIQILDALTHAHEEQVVHRDIKPRNVHLLLDGSVKLLDFGLARMGSSDPITRTGAVMGTPHYASPEQLRAEQVDARSDIFSMGALAYELLEGTRPFEGDSVSAVLLKVLSDPPAPARGAWCAAFPELEQVVQRALAKVPDERFQSAHEMRVAIHALIEAQRVPLAAFDDGQVVHRAERADAPTAVRTPSVATKDTVTLPPGAVMAENEFPQLPPPQGRQETLAMVAVGLLLVALAAGGYLQLRRPAPAVPAASATSQEASVLTGTTTAAAAERTPPTPAPASSAVVSPSYPPAAPAAASGAGRVTPSPAPVAAPPPPAMPADGAGVTSPATDAAPPAFDVKRFFAPTAPGAKNAGLRWRLIQKLDSGEETDVDPARTFHSGDRVRLAFDSSLDGYLYVAMQGSSKSWTLLLPAEEVNGGSNAVSRGTAYQVPDNGWLRFDDTPGVEEIFVVFSKQRLADMPGFKGRVRRSDGLPPRAVDDLKQRMASRDLVFEKDRPAQSTGRGASNSQAQYVVNRNELDAAVAVTIALKHER